MLSMFTGNTPTSNDSTTKNTSTPSQPASDAASDTNPEVVELKEQLVRMEAKLKSIKTETVLFSKTS